MNNVVPVERAEILRETPPLPANMELAKPLGLAEKIWRIGAVRKTLIVIALAIVWQAYGQHLNNPLIFPTFMETVTALKDGIVSGVIPDRLATSLQTLAIGYGCGIILAAILTISAVTTRLGTDFLETLTSMFNPLPAIALLPLALIWFGLGTGSIVFVIVHSVLWAMALNTHSGFRSVSNTLKMVGRNYGLSGFSLVWNVLIPAAIPSILAGLKIGWAFAWRTLIAAELVFGVSSGGGGLGWYIFENRNLLETANVFAGLFTVIIIGLVIENVVFAQFEKRTIKRWGMQN